MTNLKVFLLGNNYAVLEKCKNLIFNKKIKKKKNGKYKNKIDAIFSLFYCYTRKIRTESKRQLAVKRLKD